MSLCEAGKKTGTFQGARERMAKTMSDENNILDTESAYSGTGAQMIVARDLQDPGEIATTSEVAREELGQNMGERLSKSATVHTISRDHDSSLSPLPVMSYGGREISFPSQTPRESIISPLPTTNCEGHLLGLPPSALRQFSQVAIVRTVSSNDDSSMSPLATTCYGGSEISFPSQTPRERILSPLPTLNDEGSLLGLPPNALLQDPCSTPRVSAGNITRRYIQSEENATQHAKEIAGMEETQKDHTPIPRKFDVSNSSDNEDGIMTEVEWRDEEPYITPTKKGKKHTQGKGFKRQVRPEREIPNMPHTPSWKTLPSDRANPAESLPNENEAADLEKFIGEYLQNTNGRRDFMVGQERNDVNYNIWCQPPSNHIAARHNHTDAAVMSVRKIAQEVQGGLESERQYAAESAEKLDERLSKIERRLAKVAPVNMANTIQSVMRD